MLWDGTGTATSGLVFFRVYCGGGAETAGCVLGCMYHGDTVCGLFRSEVKHLIEWMWLSPHSRFEASGAQSLRKIFQEEEGEGIREKEEARIT